MLLDRQVTIIKVGQAGIYLRILNLKGPSLFWLAAWSTTIGKDTQDLQGRSNFLPAAQLVDRNARGRGGKAVKKVKPHRGNVRHAHLELGRPGLWTKWLERRQCLE